MYFLSFEHGDRTTWKISSRLLGQAGIKGVGLLRMRASSILSSARKALC